MFWVFLFSLLALGACHVNQPNKVGGGSCLKAGLCCPGRDSSCVVQEAPLNAIIEDLSDKPCYCDHACIKVGDCCHDFKEACEGMWINICEFLIFPPFYYSPLPPYQQPFYSYIFHKSKAIFTQNVNRFKQDWI